MEQSSTHDPKDIILELHSQEVELLMALRKNWRFGEVTIMMREGLPYRIMRVQEFIELKKSS